MISICNTKICEEAAKDFLRQSIEKNVECLLKYLLVQVLHFSILDTIIPEL